MPTDEAPAMFFRVHLESLTGFGRTLTDQLSALRRPTDEASRLAERPLPFGQFNEAFLVQWRHQAVSARMVALIGSVRDALGFAAEVTHAVATGYAQADQATADAYRALYNRAALGTVPAGAGFGPGPALYPDQPPDPFQPVQPMTYGLPATPNPMLTVPTDFTRYPLPQLVAMLAASSPHAVADAGEAWALLGRSLHERTGDLTNRLASIQDLWTGGAADQYAVMVTDLAGGVRRVADAAFGVRDLVRAAADALHSAWLDMPMAGGGAGAAAARVLTGLAACYRDLSVALPAALQSATTPAVATGESGPALGDGRCGTDPAVSGWIGTGALGDPALSSPDGGLFGRLLPAGLAAASAALGFRFVPTRQPTDPTTPAATTSPATDAATPLPDTTPAPDPLIDPSSGAGSGAGDLGGAGGLGGDFGSGGLGSPESFAAGPLGPDPVAYQGLNVAGGPVPAGADQAGITAAAGNAGLGANSVRPTTPMMPMGGAMAGAADAGTNGRRVPPWLVETEDIWGTTTVVNPAVIGE